MRVFTTVVDLGSQSAAAEHLELAAKGEDFSALFVHLDALEKALQQYIAVVATLEGL